MIDQMSELDESMPPLTRRELRLREMAAAEAASAAAEVNDATIAPVAEIAPDPITEAVAEAISNASFDIAVVDESGRPRSRKEMRELRLQAEAELAELVATGSIDLTELSHINASQPSVSAQDSTSQRLHDEQASHSAPAARPASPPPVSAPQITPEEALPKIDYSFPDIAPLDEHQSVFDDPATRLLAEEAAEPSASSGDFDDLITRAVAQEGATGSTNTSALILPSMPESDGLAGPLGETGELFITGSINLPKSLAETGGHASLHDSVEVEPLLDDLGFEPKTHQTGDIMAPVSAVRAVSARVGQGPLVAEASKDKSKFPVILISIGGALMVGAIGLIVWAAVSGMLG